LSRWFTEWHQADAIIGNPPFWVKHMRTALGDEYIDKVLNVFQMSKI